MWHLKQIESQSNRVLVCMRTSLNNFHGAWHFGIWKLRHSTCKKMLFSALMLSNSARIDGRGITLTGCSEKQRTDACMSGKEDLHCIKMYSFVSPYCLGWYDTVANTLGRLSYNCHTVDKL